MAQLSYGINISPAAYPGQPADSGYKDDRTVAAVAGPLGYGTLAVVDATNTSDFAHMAGKAPGSSTDITTPGLVLGVVVADQARTQDPTASVAQYPTGSAVPCRRQGRIWVYTEGAVTSGSPVYVRYATGTGTQLGAFRADADTSTAAVLAGAVFRSSTTAAGFAVVELNLV